MLMMKCSIRYNNWWPAHPSWCSIAPAKELTIQCDVRKKGIGAALLQDGQPIAFASHTLTDAETIKVCANWERDAGHSVCSWKVQTVHVWKTSDCGVWPQAIAVDHEETTQKCTKATTVQGMLLWMQKYDIKVMYKPGPQLYLADTLSRANLTNTAGIALVHEECYVSLAIMG